MEITDNQGGKHKVNSQRIQSELSRQGAGHGRGHCETLFAHNNDGNPLEDAEQT